MIPAVVISKKRDREQLSNDEIEFMIQGYARGSIPDYQMSALAMAIFLNGMNEREISNLTDAMIASGSRLTKVDDTPRVDKHSTGGLGDKTSLILAPLLACCELHVPMISGRGLGITGGTLDKLEAISGFKTNLSESDIESQLRSVGCVITGATDTLVPADKKLYGLRDVTATVPSIPLITASIMSKKIAETLDALVLDVKFGSGAFLATEALAEQLAASLMRVGKSAGVKTRALITDMTQPLGAMIGNACEVDESIEVLQGGGPSDVRELTIELAARLLISTQCETNLDDARLRLSRLLDNGAAMERFERMVQAQSGSLSSSRPLGKSRRFLASHSGLVSSLDGQLLGQAIIAMGGGRKIAGEAIDFSVGIKMHRKIGESVETGQPLLEILCDDESASDQALRLIEQAIVISSAEQTATGKTTTEKTATALWRDYPSIEN
ncbi:MAG: thymidine phosphorylase [Pirellula sp.]